MSSIAPGRGGNLASVAIRRPVGTLAIASVVFVLGLFFADRLPINLLPDVEYPMVLVRINYPGVAPEIVEEQVTRVLERQLAATENLVFMDTRASEGRTNINLHLAYGTDLDAALQDASRLLELARPQLPDGADAPRLFKFDPAQGAIWQAGFSSSVRNEVEVRDWVEHHLVPQLIAIQGVSGVAAAGGMEREVEVIIDQQRLRSYGIGIQQVVDTLAEENIDIAAGWMTSDSFDVLAKTDGLFSSITDIRNVLLDVPGSDRRIRLEEVAEVRDGFREQRMFARLDGVPSTLVSAFRIPGANTVEVVDQIRTTMLRLERSGFIPADIEFEVVNDESFFIRGAISSVGTAALLGGLLAMLMVLMFLGSLRKSFVIGLSIPIAIMATFALMGLSGLTLNIISLGGLALGIGLLLDNAIVMLENIYRHRDELRKPADQAAHDGAGEVVSAITAGTLTNLAAVLPFLLITGMAALIFRDLILTISFAIVTTLAAALTLVPMLAAQLGKVRFESGLSRSRVTRGFNHLVRRLRRRYRRLLPRLLRWRWLVLLASVAVFATTLSQSGRLGNEFLPQMDDGYVTVRMVLPRGTPPMETDAGARLIERKLAELPHVEAVFSMVGGHLWGGVVNERPGTANIRVRLSPASQRPDMPAGRWVMETQAVLNRIDLPGARISVRPPAIRGLQFSASGEDLAISVVGQDLATLRGIARDIESRLQGIPGLEGVELSREDQSPLMRIVIDRERAADLGLGVAGIGRAIRTAVDGSVATQYLSGNQEYDVRVRLPRDIASDAETLGNLVLYRAGGQPVLLRDIARFDLGEGPSHIERENQSRVVRVVGDLNTTIADVGSVMAQVDARLDDLDLPEQYGLIFGGQWETIQETNRELSTVIWLSVFLVFVVLAVQYERISNPLVILSAAPLALIGVAGALALSGTPISAPVMIGVILLIGIVVNNAILLVEYIEIGRRQHGLSIPRAVIAAGSVRLRPILMTTSTTLLGMTPLAIGMGEGAEIMRALALTVVGGLLVSMLLTLLVVPCLYLVINGASARLRHWLTGAGPGPHRDREERYS